MRSSAIGRPQTRSSCSIGGELINRSVDVLQEQRYFRPSRDTPRRPSRETRRCFRQGGLTKARVGAVVFVIHMQNPRRQAKRCDIGCPRRCPPRLARHARSTEPSRSHPDLGDLSHLSRTRALSSGDHAVCARTGTRRTRGMRQPLSSFMGGMSRGSRRIAIRVEDDAQPSGYQDGACRRAGEVSRRSGGRH